MKRRDYVSRMWWPRQEYWFPAARNLRVAGDQQSRFCLLSIDCLPAEERVESKKHSPRANELNLILGSDHAQTESPEIVKRFYSSMNQLLELSPDLILREWNYNYSGVMGLERHDWYCMFEYSTRTNDGFVVSTAYAINQLLSVLGVDMQEERMSTSGKPHRWIDCYALDKKHLILHDGRWMPEEEYLKILFLKGLRKVSMEERK